MSTTVKDLVAKATKALEDAAAIVTKASEENREPTSEENEQGQTLLKQAADYRDLAVKAKDRQGLADQLKALGDAVGEAESKGDDDVVRLEDVKPRKEQPARKSWGEQFTESEGFKSFMKPYEEHPGEYGEVPKSQHVDIPRQFLKGQKALLTDVLIPGTPAQDERGLVDMGAFQRPMAVRDLITVTTTNLEVIRYARVTGFTNAATGVKEAATVTGTNAAGGLKPQSNLTVEAATANVVTIAHWFAASKQALADRGYLQMLIDNFGRYGIQEEEEDQIIAGTGSANDQLEGFNTVAAVQDQTFSNNIFESIRKGITKVKKGGRSRPTGVLVNLEDDEKMDLYRQEGTAGTAGPWVGNGPFQTGPPIVWGLPRVATDAVPAGHAYVADFRTIVLFVREDISMSVTDSHSDYFVRNLIAMLFEERAALATFRPLAICDVVTA